MIAEAEDLRQQIIAHAPDWANAQPEPQETGSSRPRYGVRIPVMRQIMKTWAAANKDRVSYGHWGAILDALYKAQSVDECIMAGMLLGHFTAYRQRLPLATLDSWLAHLEGWIEVDSTCQSAFSEREMLDRIEEWEPFLKALNSDANIHKRRASLVLLVKPIRGSNVRIAQLALAQVDGVKHEHDKLITKAVSWVLREGVKSHRQLIADYIAANRDSLPALAVREVTRKLETGRK